MEIHEEQAFVIFIFMLKKDVDVNIGYTILLNVAKVLGVSLIAGE